jgi:hypothetical protein
LKGLQYWFSLLILGLLFDWDCFYNLYVSSYCVVQFRKILHNEEINSYYKGLPVFGNLTELQLHWYHKDIHDWGEVKMLQNCPKLQALQIVKVCLSQEGIQQPERIGNTHIMFLNAFCLVSLHVKLSDMFLNSFSICPPIYRRISLACKLSCIWMFLVRICIRGVFVRFYICYY